MKIKAKHTDGLVDVEMLIDHVKDEEKKTRQVAWLRAYYSNKEDNQKEKK